MPKLSDTQAVLLAAAAARSDLSVLPAPETLRLKGAALERTLKALRGRGLIAEAPMRAGRSDRSGPTPTPTRGTQPPDRHAGRARGDRGGEGAGGRPGQRSRKPTPASRAEGEKARQGRPGGKLGMLLDAVGRPEGATLEDLTAASGWLPHTKRAAITRLRQRGFDVRIAHGDAQGLSSGPGRLIHASVSETGGAEIASPLARPLEARIGALPDLSIAELRQAWAEAWGAPPPKGARRRLLMLGIAWKWQAEVEGGFSRPLERRLAMLEAAVRQSGASPMDRHGYSLPPRLVPGSRLIRVWKAERHEVEVAETGYLWRGRSWASLSSIAREITGARRNGPAFFGLRDGEAP